MFIGRIRVSYPGLYCLFFCRHQYTIRPLTKYAHTQVILQSLEYCKASYEMLGLRQRTKNRLPNLYMVGNFYMTIARICVIMIGLTVCYFLIGNS